MTIETMMSDPTITLVVNGNAYKLCATNVTSLKAINPDDRQALLSLLEALKHSDQATNQAVEQAIVVAHRVHFPSASQAARLEQNPLKKANADAVSSLKGERMGSGDIDALMARLIAEDQQSRQSRPRVSLLIKAVAVLAVMLVLLVMIF